MPNAQPTFPALRERSRTECQDDFGASGGRTATLAAAGTYAVGCTYQGQPLPWQVLGQFHAAPAARNHWDAYMYRVAEKADRQGCPAVAIRTTPPSHNGQGEAIGAFCIVPLPPAPVAVAPNPTLVPVEPVPGGAPAPGVAPGPATAPAPVAPAPAPHS